MSDTRLTDRGLRKLGTLLLATLFLSFSAVYTVGAVHNGTPPGMETNLIWHDGELWNTVVLGNIHDPQPGTLDAFYTFTTQSNPVAGAGPGDSDYNGGRWQKYDCSFNGDVVEFMDGDDVEDAIDSELITCTPVGVPFLCPLTNRNA